MQIEKHWLADARHVVSPNFNERPDPNDISLIVIHSISLPPGQYGGHYIDQLFSNQLDPTAHPYFQDIYQLQVSSHILIERSGEICQFVGFDKRAWHAGQSNYYGRTNCNDFSIGIELEGTDDSGFSDAQYASLAKLSKSLIATYPNLSRQHITGHSDIAPGRKTDPGTGFDWERFRTSLHD